MSLDFHYRFYEQERGRLKDKGGGGAQDEADENNY